MKNVIARLTVIAMLVVAAARTRCDAALANAPWGDDTKIAVGIAVQGGLSVSAWTNRGDETLNKIATMTPVGDGTYSYQLNLIPNSQYNFLFFAIPAISTGGLTAGTTYAEPVPNNGSADAGTFLSTQAAGGLVLKQAGAVGAGGPGSVLYNTANGDGRRVLTMPDLTTGDTVYVFNNFASTPTGVTNYSIAASSSSPAGGKIKLNWGGGLGYWGTGFPAADTLGGSYAIYRATGTGVSYPVTLQTTLAGTATTWTDTSVPETIFYYYIIVASDAYSNPTNPTSQTAFANLRRAVPTDGTSWSDVNNNDKRAKPANAVPVIFKVENYDEDYVKAHGGIVYMTPWNEDGRVYPDKVPGTILKAKVPSTGEGL